MVNNNSSYLIKVKKVNTLSCLKYSSNRYGVISIILNILTFGIAIYSVETARWVSPSVPLTMVFLAGACITWWLAFSRFSGIRIFFILFFGGFIVLFFFGMRYLNLPYSFSGVKQGLSIFSTVFSALVTGNAVTGILHFALLLLTLVWCSGCISVWLLLRKKNVWITLLLGLVILLINLSNLPSNYYSYFTLYVLAATGVLLWHNFFNEGYPVFHGVLKVPTSFLIIVGVALFIAGLSCTVPIKYPNFGQSKAIVSIKIFWQERVHRYLTNALSEVPAKLPYLSSSDQRQMILQDYADRREEDIQFIVKSSRPCYWKTATYKDYSGTGWSNGEIGEVSLDSGVRDSSLSEIVKRATIKYSVFPQLKTNVLLLAGDFVEADCPVLIQYLKKDGRLLKTGEMGVLTSYQLDKGQMYNVMSLVGLVSEAELSRVDDEYPAGVVENFLELPEDFSVKIRQLSVQITQNCSTPYKKVIAVKDYLSGFKYSPENKKSPEDKDPIEEFLFQSKTGNCGYFASAAVLLLRASGVPARLAVGYLSDEWDEKTGTNVLRIKHYHAWPEVYFSGYGWIEFEATPSGTGSSPVPVGVLSPFIPEEGYPAQPESYYYWYSQSAENSFINTEPARSSVVVPHRSTVVPLAIIYTMLGLFLLYILKCIFFSIIHRYGVLHGKPDFTDEIYRKLSTVAGWYGIKPSVAETPLEFMGRLSKAYPDFARSAHLIVSTYLEVIYGPEKRISHAQEIMIQKAWVEFYNLALSGLFKRRFLIAPVSNRLMKIPAGSQSD